MTVALHRAFCVTEGPCVCDAAGIFLTSLLSLTVIVPYFRTVSNWLILYQFFPPPSLTGAACHCTVGDLYCSQPGIIIIIIIIYWSLLYSTVLRSRADSLRLHVILCEWIAFYSAFLNIHRSGVLTALAWLVPQESAARESVSAHSVYTIQPCTVSLHAKPHT